MSSPNLGASRGLPQQRQPVGLGSITRSRGRCLGEGWRAGRRQALTGGSQVRLRRSGVGRRTVRLSPVPLSKAEKPGLSARLWAVGLVLGSPETRRVLRDRINRRQYLCRAIFQYRSAADGVGENATPGPIKSAPSPARSCGRSLCSDEQFTVVMRDTALRKLRMSNSKSNRITSFRQSSDFSHGLHPTSPFARVIIGVGFGARRAVPAAEAERRLWVQKGAIAGMRRNGSGPSRPRPRNGRVRP